MPGLRGREHLRPLPPQEHLHRVQASQSSACSTSCRWPRKRLSTIHLSRLKMFSTIHLLSPKILCQRPFSCQRVRTSHQFHRPHAVTTGIHCHIGLYSVTCGYQCARRAHAFITCVLRQQTRDEREKGLYIGTRLVTLGWYSFSNARGLALCR